MEGNKKYIPNNLRKFRRLLGFSQEDVRRRLGLSSVSIVSRWERGVTMPDSDNLIRLGRLYKTLIEELYYDVVKEHERKIFPDEFSKNKPSIGRKRTHFDHGP